MAALLLFLSPHFQSSYTATNLKVVSTYRELRGLILVAISYWYVYFFRKPGTKHGRIYRTISSVSQLTSHENSYSYL